MKWNEVFGGVVVKDGYSMLALVNDGEYWHAIIHRNNATYEPWVFCICYDIKDGTWGQGHYHSEYAHAVQDMAEYLAD